MDPLAISGEEEHLADEIKRMLTDQKYYDKYQEAARVRAKDFSNAGYVECIRGWIG